MSKLVPWSRYLRRKQIDPALLLARFKSYQEFCQWFIQLGGNPPPLESVSKYFDNIEKESLELDPPVVKEKVPVTVPDLSKPSVGMKNTKVQLLEIAAAHDVVVSYYDTKAKILQQMNRSGKFNIIPTRKK